MTTFCVTFQNHSRNCGIVRRPTLVEILDQLSDDRYFRDPMRIATDESSRA